MDMYGQQVVRTLQVMIEASLYVAPTEFGLTWPELIEVGGLIGLKQGRLETRCDGLMRSLGDTIRAQTDEC
jgi:hypothetical protein